LPFADELMRQSSKRQLLEVQKTHAFGINMFVGGFQQLKRKVMEHAGA
jgi:hypothetical protein